MDIKQITASLKQIFEEYKKRIVFWYDREGEFSEIIPSLELEGVTILRLDETGPFELKIKLELEDTESRYVIYAPYPEPVPEEDWLLDIRLYSYTFHADKASIVLDELGLTSQGMRLYLKGRKNFFRSQERLNNLKKWVSPEDSEDDLDLKMLAVVTKADQPDVFYILMKILHSFCAAGSFDPNQEPKVWEEIKKLELDQPFWEFMARTFGYVNDSPNLSDLLIRLLVTDFGKNIKADLPVGIDHFLIRNDQQGLNASVFLSQWRSHIIYSHTYNLISGYFAEELNIQDQLLAFDSESLSDIMTFEAVEHRIIRLLRDKIVADKHEEFGSIREIIQQRRNGHWTGRAGGNANLYEATYNALETGIELFRLRNKYSHGLSYPSAEVMFHAYTTELFRFDQFYRQFHQAADIAELGGWDVLKTLQAAVEDCYSGWFTDQIALAWDSFLEQGQAQGLLHKWSLSGVHNQCDFFAHFVRHALRSSSRTRVFVVISDAFRYEAAEELATEINSKYRFKAKLEAMLGVLPSITVLGMGALLPHETITFKDFSSSEVLVDEKPAATLEQRAAILEKVNGTAIKAADLLSMNKEQGREFVKPHRVVYIYHNQVDAVGDKAATESKTFEAVRKTVEELSALVRFIINSLNGSHVIVTADHGFIYQEKGPGHTDKSVLNDKPSGAVVAKKRFILGKNLGESSKVWHGSTRITACTEEDMEFWLPKGMNRFHFVGGAKFFHGGAMLQEIVVPVITIRELWGKAVQKSEISKVGVSLLGVHKKVVTNIHRFEFIQTDAVSERVRPRNLLISLRDGNDIISSEETVTFDSSSSSMDERKKSVRLMLKSREYDSKKEYALVLRDPETDIEYERISVTIDLAFINDFQQ